MELILQYVPGFLLVFCRVTSFFLIAPAFSARNVPATFKIGLSACIALMAVTLLPEPFIAMNGMFVASIIKEIVIGLLLGFVAYMFFTVAQIAGAFIDYQIGFGLANVVDPMSGIQSPLLGNLKYMLAIVLFLTMNGHHFLISGMIDSYEWVPLSNEALVAMYDGSVAEFLTRSFATVFMLAFQMAAPLVATLFLVDVGLGILAKTAPQFNVFVLGLPLKILVALIMLVTLITGYNVIFSGLFETLLEAVQRMVQLLSGAN